MKRLQKKKYLLLTLLGVFTFLGNNSYAQIALAYQDTTICPGNTIQMCAALSGHASSLNTDDNFTGVINLGFPFSFFGQTYTKCVISGNGMISFDTTQATQFAGWMWSQISTSGQANNAIFATFLDLYLPAGGKIWYQTFGAPGHRKFVVEWCHIPLFGCNSLFVTSQLILSEGTNIIEVHTTLIDAIAGNCPSASAGYYGQVVQGVRDQTGTISYYPTNRDPISSTTNWGINGITDDARKFIPIGGTPFSYKIDSIPFAPVVIIDSSRSANLQWYSSTQPYTPFTIGACATATPDGSQDYYFVKFHGHAGCEDNLVDLTDTIFIHYGTKYNTINKTICEGESFSFLGRPLYQSGQYDTLFTATGGCDSFVTLNLTVNPLPDVSMQEKSSIDLCQGDSVRISILNPESTTTYQWTLNGANVSGGNQPSLMVQNAGSYVLNAISNMGCKASTNPISVAVHDVPIAAISPLQNDIICAYDTLQLSVENSNASNSYIWEPSKPFRTVAGNETPTVSGVFLVPTEVTLTVFNKFGCSSQDSVLVSTKPCCEVFVPNAFSPNGDGRNDYFKPALQNGQILTSMRIYNRLGQLVYDNNNEKLGWNGTMNDGKAAPSDTYVYLIEYTCADGQLYRKKGTLSLVR